MKIHTPWHTRVRDLKELNNVDEGTFNIRDELYKKYITKYKDSQLFTVYNPITFMPKKIDLAIPIKEREK